MSACRSSSVLKTIMHDVDFSATAQSGWTGYLGDGPRSWVATVKSREERGRLVAERYESSTFYRLTLNALGGISRP